MPLDPAPFINAYRFARAKERQFAHVQGGSPFRVQRQDEHGVWQIVAWSETMNVAQEWVKVAAPSAERPIRIVHWWPMIGFVNGVNFTGISVVVWRSPVLTVADGKA